MASGGRGRGRGRAVIFLKDNKPGGLQETENKDDELSQLLQNLNVQPGKDSIQSIVSVASNQATNKDSIEKIVNAIYEPCYRDWRFGNRAAIVCQNLVHIEADGVRFRDVLLRTIQRDYKSKESLRTDSNDKFAGFLAFLCQIFNVLRGADGAPFTPLVNPILDCLEMTLDKNAQEKELECACEQILVIGMLIHRYGDAGRLHNLKKSVRNHILDSKVSREVRSRLLDALEAASSWKTNVSNGSS